MNAADIELARWAYLASTLAVYLLSSMILRGLWRPLRFVLLALVISVFFTPFFIEQKMPDGSQQNIVPAFVVMLYDAANDRDNWREGIKRAGKPIAAVAGITSLIALALALLLPKPVRRQRQPGKQPDDTGNKEKSGSNRKRNPYLPEDFQPQ